MRFYNQGNPNNLKCKLRIKYYKNRINLKIKILKKIKYNNLFNCFKNLIRKFNHLKSKYRFEKQKMSLKDKIDNYNKLVNQKSLKLI